MKLAALLAFGAVRVQDAARIQLQVHEVAQGEEGIHSSHAEGLEAEHELEYIAHDTANASGWTVTTADQGILKQIQDLANPPNRDVEWKWRDDPSKWTFGAVKITAGTAKKSLALHMLHRHGLAPLLCAYYKDKFDAHMVDAKGDGQAAFEFLVQNEEQFGKVRAMETLLNQLTLSALRNLHSYDHQWSVDQFAGKVDGCTQSNGGACILQAGTSPAAYSFLTGHGVDARKIKAAGEEGSELFQRFARGETGVTNDLYGKYMKPGQTGKKATHALAIKKVEGSDQHYLQGTVYWEDGGVSQGVSIPLSAQEWEVFSQMAALNSESEDWQRSNWFQGMAAVFLERHIERKMHQHHSYFREHRLTWWTQEQAEFAEMYPRYESATQP